MQAVSFHKSHWVSRGKTFSEKKELKEICSLNSGVRGCLQQHSSAIWHRVWKRAPYGATPQPQATHLHSDLWLLWLCSLSVDKASLHRLPGRLEKAGCWFQGLVPEGRDTSSHSLDGSRVLTRALRVSVAGPWLACDQHQLSGHVSGHLGAAGD